MKVITSFTNLILTWVWVGGVYKTDKIIFVAVVRGQSDIAADERHRTGIFRVHITVRACLPQTETHLL